MSGSRGTLSAVKDVITGARGTTKPSNTRAIEYKIDNNTRTILPNPPSCWKSC
jgi:hypothetical protein